MFSVRPLAAAMRTSLIAASFSFGLTSMLASSNAPALHVLASFLASMCVPFPYSTRAGVDALRRFADECTGNLLLEDDHLTGHAQRSEAHTAPSPSPVRTHRQYAPARYRTLARGRLALADAALHMFYVQLFKIELCDHLVDRPEVRSMRLPLGSLSSPPVFPAPCSPRAGERWPAGAGNHLLGRANASGHTLIVFVLATALGGAARRG
jgi:hypothetical protein